jgi:hypothetical protein
VSIGDWSAPAVLSIAFFGGWFALSLIGQLWPRESWIRRSSISWLLPDWRFFAPEPGVEDFVVVYRSRSAADEVGPLVAIPPLTSGALRALWNPGTRRHKALFDLTDGVQRMAQRLIARESSCSQPRSGFPDALMLTAPYLVLLSLVSTRVGPGSPELVQFGIVHRGWPDHEDLVFLSRWHSIES